jgi:hypothetical protein
MMSSVDCAARGPDQSTSSADAQYRRSIFFIVFIYSRE